MARLKLNDASKGILVELYRRSGRTADDLPYTEEFESPYAAFGARTGLTMTRHDVWKALASSRKSKLLVRKVRGSLKNPDIP